MAVDAERTPVGASAHRGRPRSASAREAIVGAAFELLVQDGLRATTMDAVAARAGVSKATIYRWWRSKPALALDALYERWQAASGPVEDTGSLRQDLLGLVRPWLQAAVTTGSTRILADLIDEAHADPAVAELYLDRFIRPRRERARGVFERARARGEISAAVDLDVAIDLLYGPLYHRLLHQHAEPDDAFAVSVVGLVIAALEPGRAAR